MSVPAEKLLASFLVLKQSLPLCCSWLKLYCQDGGFSITLHELVGICKALHCCEHLKAQSLLRDQGLCSPVCVTALFQVWH